MTTATRTIQDFVVGERVETIVQPPHAAAFSGVVIAIGARVVLVRNEEGFERAYTPRSFAAKP